MSPKRVSVVKFSSFSISMSKMFAFELTSFWTMKLRWVLSTVTCPYMSTVFSCFTLSSMESMTIKQAVLPTPPLLQTRKNNVFVVLAYFKSFSQWKGTVET